MAERPSDLLPPRWYVVNNYGKATLCVDENDARSNVIEADRRWPFDAPYVAVQLAPVRTLDAAPSEPSTESADELARLRAEVAENKREIDELVRAVNLGSERAKKAERERDELRCALGKAHNYLESLKIGLEIADEIDALVRLDAKANVSL